jgi:AAA family ATP:ADP antiporter
MEKAKRFYPPLMLGSSLGTMLAGPIIVFCTSLFSWNFLSLSPQRWQHSLYLLTMCLILCGLLILVVFSALFKKLHVTTPLSLHCEEKKKEPFSRRLLSLSSSVKYLLKSKYLCSLLIIVLAEYVAYALGELIFLETLKQMYPSPSEYCLFMGNLTFWIGVITGFSALILTPYLLQNYKWTYSALITPILMIAMTFAFFFVVCLGKVGYFSLTAAVILGSLHFVIGRSTKNTIFDATKELAFIPLDQEAQVKGKLIIDGIGSRLGRGTSSLLSIFLFLLMGGPGESALFAGIIAIVFALFAIPPFRYVGHEFEKMNASTTAEATSPTLINGTDA